MYTHLTMNITLWFEWLPVIVTLSKGRQDMTSGHNHSLITTPIAFLMDINYVVFLAINGRLNPGTQSTQS